MTRLLVPVNGEAELIRLHAEVLRLRVPKRSRTDAKSRTPARGSGR